MDYGECKAGTRVSDERKMKGVCGEGQTREPEGRRLAPQLEERRQEALPKSERGLFRSAWSRAWESPYRRPRASGRRAPSPVLFLRPRISRQHPQIGSLRGLSVMHVHERPPPRPVPDSSEVCVQPTSRECWRTIWSGRIVPKVAEHIAADVAPGGTGAWTGAL